MPHFYENSLLISFPFLMVLGVLGMDDRTSSKKVDAGFFFLIIYTLVRCAISLSHSSRILNI